MTDIIFGDSLIIRDKSTNKRLVNTQTTAKWLIECEPGKYRVGNVSGVVPHNMDCIIDGWHFKQGKIVRKGTITLIPGTGHFIITRNLIEN